jgi:hypothetical protein
VTPRRLFAESRGELRIAQGDGEEFRIPLLQRKAPGHLGLQLGPGRAVFAQEEIEAGQRECRDLQRDCAPYEAQQAAAVQGGVGRALAHSVQSLPQTPPRPRAFMRAGTPRVATAHKVPKSAADWK